MFAISEEFRQRIISVWGERGQEWLELLPARISTCTDRWGLSIQSPAPTLSYNFVAFVVTADGRDAVLKLGVPTRELTTEIEALRTYQDQPVVRLLDADTQLGALLLRRLVPGTPLSKLDDDQQATLIAAPLIRDIPIPEPAQHIFPTVGDWALAFDRLRARFDGGTGPLPAKMVEKTERLVRELHASSSRKMVLHGDVHHDNILYDDEDGWIAIDPKGVIGDPAYEAARLQHNPIPQFLSMDYLQSVVQRRIEILASVLQEDRARLLAWAFVDAMFAACWSIEDDADEWEYHLACAELFDVLVQ